MKPIQFQFRAARSLCRWSAATKRAAAARACSPPSERSDTPEKEEDDAEPPEMVLPESEGSYAQVAGLVAPSGAPNPVCGLTPVCNTREVSPLRQQPGVERLKRPNPLSVRFSAVELEIVKAKARMVGSSTNGYVRAAALGSSYCPPRDPELKRILLGLARELTAQGNNLNQVARRLNAGTAPAMHGAMLEALTASLQDILQRVREALARSGPAA
jgi:hypothetical protein